MQKYAFQIFETNSRSRAGGDFFHASVFVCPAVGKRENGSRGLANVQEGKRVSYEVRSHLAEYISRE